MVDMFNNFTTQFLKMTEYANSSRIDCDIKVVHDIIEYVKNDDSEYSQLENLKEAYGLFYVTSKGKLEIIILETDNIVELLHNLFHEMVHLYDFVYLSEYRGEPDIRKLQEDTFFILWSEFHAEYLVYKYFLSLNENSINPFDVRGELIHNYNQFVFGKRTLAVQKMTNFCVRLFGEYMALTEKYEEIDKLPMEIFFNQAFCDLYVYLKKHKSIEQIMGDYPKLKKIFLKLKIRKSTQAYALEPGYKKKW